MKFPSSRRLVFLVAATLLVTCAYAQVVEIPTRTLKKPSGRNLVSLPKPLSPSSRC